MGAIASQITSRVTGLCAGNSHVTGEFLARMASNAEMILDNLCIGNLR